MSEIHVSKTLIERYHEALNEVLSLFIVFNGWDYSCVDDALEILVENIDTLPTRMALVECIEQRRRKITNES